MSDPIDRGDGRSVADMAHADERLVAITRVLQSLQTGMAGRNEKNTLHKYLQAYDSDKAHVDAVRPLVTHGIINSLVCGAIAYARPLDPEMVDAFAASLRDMADPQASKGIVAVEAGDPALALLSWLRRQNLKGYKPALAYVTLNAIRSYLTGEKRTNMHSHDAGYRWISRKRRELGVPNTPSSSEVPFVESNSRSQSRKTKVGIDREALKAMLAERGFKAR
jgi:hypothetical protein